jgi:hypothetical protein
VNVGNENNPTFNGYEKREERAKGRNEQRKKDRKKDSYISVRLSFWQHRHHHLLKIQIDPTTKEDER